MDPPILDDGLHHQLVPHHHDQSATYGISSSSSSVHSPAHFFPDPSIFWTQHLPPPQDNQMTIGFSYPPLPPYTSYDHQDESVPPGAREKKHSCQLCNKRFDRPSTLKKHMLVHTGEKAWACEICKRRFSVSSNLNRHTRRCREKWVKADNPAVDTLTTTSSASSSPPEHIEASPPLTDGPDPYRPPSPYLADRPKQRQPTVQYEPDDGSHSHDHHHVAGKPHRRRRKGSPTEPWIPASLVNFNHEPVTGESVPTPLPAVVPNKFEERNSYDNTPVQAYHPSCWTGQLVGPSYAPRNEEFPRGRFCGKVLVF